jgi:hypothetical protein
METIEKYYEKFHNYLVNTDAQKMSYKKLDKFINILYYNWPESIKLYDFVRYRKEYTKCPVYIEYLSRVKKTRKDIYILPVLTPAEIFSIYSLDKHFELGTRYWCGMKYRIFRVDENGEIKAKKINNVQNLIKILEKCRDEYLLGKCKDELNRKYGFDLSNLFNEIFSNIKSYRSIIPKRYYDSIDHYNDFSHFKEEKEKEPYKKLIKNLLKMKPEKVIFEYHLDKIFDVSRGDYPDFKYIFYDEDMALGF